MLFVVPVPLSAVFITGTAVSIFVTVFVAALPACPASSNATAVIVQFFVILNATVYAVPVALVGIVPSVVYLILL